MENITLGEWIFYALVWVGILLAIWKKRKDDKMFDRWAEEDAEIIKREMQKLKN